MDKEKKYFKELKKKVDIYFVIILSMLSSLSVYILYERKILNQENIYVLMTILTISFIVYIFSIKENFKSKNINELDKAIFFSNIILITSLFMIIVIKSIKNRNLLLIDTLTKRILQQNITISFVIITTSIIIVLILLSLILMSIRSYLYKEANKTKEDDENICTLWDIYMGNFNLYTLLATNIIDSKKIKGDLFERKSIIDNISNTILSSLDCSNSFTIGIVGEWGSGKSTIIELVKEDINKNEIFKKNVIIVDDFDPWAIKSQDALILAIYNTIMEKLGGNIGYYKRKKVQNALINISTNIPYIGKGISNFFENRIDDYSEYKEIKTDLEEKLKKSNNRLIFIIDNLDRMSSDNVLLLLTLIGTLFKLPNITYIIAYDRERINEIISSDKINSKYIEKIVNKEIAVPKIHDLDKKQIFYDCLKNLMEYDSHFKNSGQVDNETIEKYTNEVLQTIASKFNNIRDFIRFLNFVLYPMTFTQLNRLDFLIIKLIQFFNNELYNNISNYKYFITKPYFKLANCSTEEKIFFEKIKKSKFFDLLELLSLRTTSFYFLDDEKDYYNVPFGLINNLKLFEFSICNKNCFDDYFSHNSYSNEHKTLLQRFEIANNVNYSNIEKFFNENNKFLDNNYIYSLILYLFKIKTKKDYSTQKFKMNLFSYFLDVIVNDVNFEESEDFILKRYISEFALLLILGLDEETLNSEAEPSEEIKISYTKIIIQFLEDIKSYDLSLYEKTINNLIKWQNHQFYNTNYYFSIILDSVVYQINK